MLREPTDNSDLARGARAPENLAAEWEQRYTKQSRVWTGNPNPALVQALTEHIPAAETAAQQPASALDIGCGEGADAVWLAKQGWQVTGIDLSQTAIARAQEHGRENGVADQLTFEVTALADFWPQGADHGFDLVTVSYLHSRDAQWRQSVLRDALSRVAPGGYFLLTSHSQMRFGSDGADGAEPMDHSPVSELDVLGVATSDTAGDEPQWEVLSAKLFAREMPGAGETRPHSDDTVVLLRKSDAAYTR